MSFAVKLGYLKATAAGGWEYRRRTPKDVAGTLGKLWLKRVLPVSRAARDGEVLRAWTRIHEDFEREIAEARSLALRKPGSVFSNITQREAWRAAQRRAESLLEGAVGMDEDEARAIVAEGVLAGYPVDPEEGYPVDVAPADALLVKAIRQPEAGDPIPTLADARKLYISEKLASNGDPQAVNRLDRILGRVAVVLGPLDKIRLDSLRREDARRVRNEMLDTPRQGGGKLSASTVKRELNIIKAVVSFGIAEFDLKNKAQNPFASLGVDVGKNEAPGASAKSKRVSLPETVKSSMRASLKGDLLLIWRLLDGTGCRGNEIAGLRVADVKLDDEFPHLMVTWHEDRRVKTASSIRPVPLIGDALEAAKEAVEAAKDRPFLFPRYVGERGGDTLSAALMKHVRKFTKDSRHVVYSLRHEVTDKLRLAGVSKLDEDAIMGHSSGDVAVRHYGSEKAALKMAYRAMEMGMSSREEPST